MHQITLPNGTELLLVGVSDKTVKVEPCWDGESTDLIAWRSRNTFDASIVKLPPGQWQLLGTLSPDLVPDFEVGELVKKMDSWLKAYRWLYHN